MSENTDAKECLDSLLRLDKPLTFGPSFIQRNCFVWYTTAMRALELGVKEGVLERDGNYQYRVTL